MGQPVLVREWRKGSSDDERTLDELWRNELRLLYRLAGSPGAADTIANLADAGKDSSGYYIVIAVGQRRPIALYLPDKSGNLLWLRQTASALNRRRLWENLRRIVLGLEVLHFQGLIHCNLDAWSVLSSGGSEPDFQLTGFEWAMRLAGVQRKTTNRRGENASHAYSFMDDWASFAHLAASLLNLKEERLGDAKLSASEVSETVSADEVSLVRDLISPPHLLQIDGEYVKSRIDRIITDLQDAAAADDAQYYLVAGIDQRGSLSQAIREASGLSIEIDDVAAQLEFVRSDLSQEPRILAAEGKTGRYYAIRGAQLVYPIAQYIVKNANQPTWEFAKVERAEAAVSWKGRVVSSSSLPMSSITILTFTDAARRTGRLRGRVLSWDRLFATEDQSSSVAKRQQRFLTAVTMLHALELVLASADLFPVEITSIEDTVGDEIVTNITLTLSSDENREGLWLALGLRPFRERLKSLLEADAMQEDEGWLLADKRRLSRRTGTDISIEFDHADFGAEPATYTFRSKSPVAPGRRDAMLIPGALRGALEQFQRRGKSIQGLQEHAELLSTLSDPRSTAKISIEQVTKDKAFNDLDPAKQSALEDMFAVLPIYGVQGPPGVGKTYLVREAVRRSFQDEPASRILLSAQSHFAVDHLMNELVNDWKQLTETKPLAVRSRSREAKAPPSPLDVSAQRTRLIHSALAGDLYNDASTTLQKRLDALVGTPSGEQRSQATIDKRTLDALVLRAANIVFATSNSRDLERLYDERGQFDWTIIEEAGKATGVELLLPLLLSHRRLMIGDHKQLPPFGSDQIDRLLDQPSLLKKSLSDGLQLVERDFKQSIGDELMDILDDKETEQEMDRLCADAKRVLQYFRSLIDDELTRQAKPGARPPKQASMLSVQHRMHPTIAEMVSHCFYEGTLKTWHVAENRFKTSSAPLMPREGSSLLSLPVTIIDMPYQQSAAGKRNVEGYPRYTNAEEVDAVLAVLRNIEPSPGAKPPTLAILSPYAQQVLKIRNSLNNTDVQLVRRFTPSVRDADWLSTVDSFQGNEADAVILSLVRNNHHSTVRSALGFLSLEQRMNVALSRAKWRLFVVTSLDFLRTVVLPIGAPTSPEVEFLRRFLDWVEINAASGAIAVIPAHRLDL